ncbi:MAG: sugar kinase [Desulfobacteraceae bacterium]|nr:MAG: sugar kinase [Desulfobacteraceae bacterium]
MVMSGFLDDVRVIGLGQACVDYRGVVPDYPSEDTKMEIEKLFSQVGGPAAVALMCLSRFGVKTAFFGSIGDDVLGERIAETLDRERIVADGLKKTKGSSSQFAFIAVTRDSAKRTIFWSRGTAPHLTAAEVDLRPYKGARILHVDGLMTDAAAEAARQAKEMGILVVMDAGTFRNGTREIAALVDILIASETFAVPLVAPGAGLDAQLQALKALGPRNVVITLGSSGSIGLENGVVHRQDAFRVKTLDTTGAGDVYHGAYIYGLLKGWGMPECMRFASAAAAVKCSRINPDDFLPSLKDIELILSRKV